MVALPYSYTFRLIPSAHSLAASCVCKQTLDLVSIDSELSNRVSRDYGPGHVISLDRPDAP